MTEIIVSLFSEIFKICAPRSTEKVAVNVLESAPENLTEKTAETTDQYVQHLEEETQSIRHENKKTKFKRKWIYIIGAVSLLILIFGVIFSVQRIGKIYGERQLLTKFQNYF